MTRVERSKMIHTIVKGYMNDLNNHKTQEEIKDILTNHFYTVATSSSGIDASYFEEEFQIWSNK